MYPAGIKDYEEKFERTRKDSDGTEYEIDKVNSYSFPLAFIKPKDVTDFYYPVKENKTAIVLHFTVGYLTGDIASLVEQGSHMSVPFVIGRNGTVYQLFSSNYWSYHLGRNAIGGNTYNSKRSIGIELSNIGPLTRENGDLYNIYNQKYCSIDEEDFYEKIEIPFRKYSYFATITEEQYTSLRELLIYLCDKYSIPHTILPENQRFRLFTSKKQAQLYQGICSHVNYRAYGKVDLGPAFNWDRIIPTTIV